MPGTSHVSHIPGEAPYRVRRADLEGRPLYERVYRGGYAEYISSQAYLAELARSRNGWRYGGDWGKAAGTISKLDFAIIAVIPFKSPEEGEAYLRDYFPETHPLRERAYKKESLLGLDYCVFEVDGEHAIIAYSGTQITDLGDFVADAQIGLGRTPFQAQMANSLIQLSPYSHILVTGYSLGGYLASDVAIYNSKVKECVVFNAPGRGGIAGTGAADPDGDPNPKITNYYAEGDNVHKVGIQPGKSYPVDVGPDALVYGPLGKHELTDVVKAFALEGSPEGPEGCDSRAAE